MFEFSAGLGIKWKNQIDSEPRMKLIYVKQWGMGRAELSRLILAYAEAEYEDCRIDKEDFANLQPSKNRFWLKEYIETKVTYVIKCE